MEKYKLKEDIVWGVLQNGEPNIIFKKGDVIQGVEIERFIFNKITKGVESKPTVSSAKVETSDVLAFVPLSSIEKITDITITNVAPQTFLEKNKTNLLIVGVLVLGYLAYKKFKK